MTVSIYTDFFMTTPRVLERLVTTDAVLALFSDTNLVVSGTNVSEERLNALMQTFSITPIPQVQRVAMAQTVTVGVYLLPSVLCANLITMPYEAVLDAAVAWSDSFAWQPIPINPFDLAGFLLELQHLCQAATHQQHYVYLMQSHATDWQPLQQQDMP